MYQKREVHVSKRGIQISAPFFYCLLCLGICHLYLKFTCVNNKGVSEFRVEMILVTVISKFTSKVDVVATSEMIRTKSVIDLPPYIADVINLIIMDIPLKLK